MAEHIIGCGCGSSLLLSLADDVLGIIATSLSVSDFCSLSMCCKCLNVTASFDKIWLTQCEELGVLSSTDLVEWRKAVLSYKALCRFLTSVKPLLGIWVNQNPELGNVVYVMPGFTSVVGCRVIPQKVGPLGIDGSPILWAPVFEVVSDYSGACAFVLHGRVKGQDYIYPGTMKSIEKTCNVLLLEVESIKKKKKKMAHFGEDGKRFRIHSKLRSRSQTSNWLRFGHKRSVMKPFNKLSFEDRQKLLESVTGSVCVKVPNSTASDSLFPCLRGGENKHVAHLSVHRETLIKMHELGDGYGDWTANHAFSSELRDFLKSGDTVGLTLQASIKNLAYYQSAWPYTNGSLFALYKLPIREPTVGREYAGLWGGTFGWPPRKPTKKKSLFFVLLSYNEPSPGTIILRGTKILEGKNDARHPNGSSMFFVDVDTPSVESFPWNSGADALPVRVTQAFAGKGISGGYTFRYPGSKPGSLFVLDDGMLAFIWTETRNVMTLQKLNLDELLRKGQRVPPLPPVDNFSYLRRSYSNVFTDLKS